MTQNNVTYYESFSCFLCHDVIKVSFELGEELLKGVCPHCKKQAYLFTPKTGYIEWIPHVPMTRASGELRVNDEDLRLALSHFWGELSALCNRYRNRLGV